MAEQKATQFKNKLRNLVQRLHELARSEQNIMQRIDVLDRTAGDLGDTELEITLRKSFTKMVDCGRMLTQAHIDLNVPAAVIHRPEHQGK